MPPLVVVGGAVSDITATASDTAEHVLRTSSPGTIRSTPGGVGRNIAEAALRIGVSGCLLVAAVGSDERGRMIQEHSEAIGLRTEGLITLDGAATATYCAVLSRDGELVGAVADMSVLKQLTAEHVRAHGAAISGAQCLVCDGNISASAMQAAISAAGPRTVTVFEPTSVAKSVLPMEAGVLGFVDVVTPNEDEVLAMARSVDKAGAAAGAYSPERRTEVSVLKAAAQQLIFAGVQCVIVTRGPLGVLVVSARGPAGDREARGRRVRLADTGAGLPHMLRAPEPCSKIVSVTGAGDSLVAGFVSGICSGHSFETSLRLGLRAACATLESRFSVAEDIRERCAGLLMGPKL